MNFLVDHPVLFAIPSVALIAAAAWLLRAPKKPRVRRCIVCGCTDLRACPGGCGWATLHPPVCTTCHVDDDELADRVFSTAA